MKFLNRSIPAAFLLAVSLFSASPSARATTVYALTDTGSILTFDHTTPGTISSNVTITGLGGYTLLAIDVRPTVQANPSQPGVGSVWAIGQSGNNFQLFVVNPTTGVATAIGLGPITAGISGTPGNNEWGFDFDPAADRIRLVDSSQQDSYLLNPNNGVLLQQDGDLAFAGGDPNNGTAPQIDAAAYSTTTFGGTSSLYFLDSNLNILAKSTNPTSGTIVTVGSLTLGGSTLDIAQPNGFDILDSLALFSAPNGATSTLYSVNLTSGVVTSLGDFPAGTNIRGLAIAVPVPPVVVNPPFLRVVGKEKRKTTSSRADIQIRSYDESGAVAVSFRQTRNSASYKFVRGTGIKFTAIARQLKFGNNPVIVRATDPDGNVVEKRIVITRTH
ncbi:MAG TPA: DUF4394 domain-containing protein [Chthoniobacterales bacterium]|nr:DUF4394 domain-containing protein [Chthoniobacterales bacterium]